ncbi:Crp/Fnr family transcriptional regulator [Ruthenibacterium sp. CLA-JM-H11]|uniref:Crp/Fnr family transcriptional regulator n=1 Tax=Ruthenibacterium intestinale TaxID=3133163 RepID=A0ABV1GIY2_9FIRM
MENFSQWSDSPLFAGLDAAQRAVLLRDLSAGQKEYEKGQTILRTGQRVTALGLVLRGGANVVRRDAWGNENILDHVRPGQVFAEAYACVPDALLLVDVTAAEPTCVLFLEPARLWREDMPASGPHLRFLHNLLQAAAAKNLVLTRKIGHITPHTIRERLLSYLSAEAVRQGADVFDIPFNRQQLADYLCVERSALSGELSRAQRDGLLRFHKNHFELCRPAQKQVPKGS